jgi:hypothetical protein
MLIERLLPFYLRFLWWLIALSVCGRISRSGEIGLGGETLGAATAGALFILAVRIWGGY